MIRVPLMSLALPKRRSQQDLGIWLKCRLGLSHLDCKPDRIVLVSTVRQPSGQGRVLLGSTVPAAA